MFHDEAESFGGAMDSDFNSPSRMTADPTGRPVFLLLESNPIIATDMMGILELSCDCSVVHVSDAQELPKAVSNVPRLTAAFLEIGVAELSGSEIEDALRHHRANIVLTQGESLQLEAQERGWYMLIRPFTEQMVKDVLHEMRIPR